MRTLLLFDIDGTLMWGGGAVRPSFREALLATYGRTGPIETHEFSGKTDPQIVRELLRSEGLDDTVIEAGFDGFWELYLTGLSTRIVEAPPHALPGAVEIVERFRTMEDVALGLVTGNIARAAEIKLGTIGLEGVFRIGGFGSDHEVRNHLPGIALERAAEAWSVDFAPDAVWVIGDSPATWSAGSTTACGPWRSQRDTSDRRICRGPGPTWSSRTFSTPIVWSRLCCGVEDRLCTTCSAGLIRRSRRGAFESQAESDVAKQYGKDKNKDGNGSGGMKPFVIVLGAAVLIAVGSVAWSSMRATFSGAATEAIDIEFADVNELVGMATGIERGDPDADILIMEFADFQCPSCQFFATNVKPQVDLAYIESGIARFVLHDFPLVQHPHAFLAARAARCALDQGDDNYWPYHDMLFQNQGSWSPSPGPPIGAFESYAEQIGLDRGQFSECLNSDRHAEVVTANMELGRQLNVSGTPTIFMSRGGGMATRVSRWSEFGAIQEIVEQFQAAGAAEGGESSGEGGGS